MSTVFSDDVILLVKGLDEKDDDGFQKEKRLKETPAFATIKSVKQTEYYQASAAGIKVQVVAVVNQADYDDACYVSDSGQKAKPNYMIYDGNEYKCGRLYLNQGVIEITLEEITDGFI